MISQVGFQRRGYDCRRLNGHPRHRNDRSYIDRMASKPLVIIRPRRPTPILVCKKCLTRVDDGKQFRRELKSQMKHRNTTPGGKRPRVILTGCFGICPKRAVVLASAATLQRGEYVLVSDNAAVAKAAALLMPDNES